MKSVVEKLQPCGGQRAVSCKPRSVRVFDILSLIWGH